MLNTKTRNDKNNNPLAQKITKYLSIGAKPGKIAELDGLRAIAILMVLFFHFATYYREYHGSYFVNLFSTTIQNIMFNGWLGVDLFFVLSGYLIFHHLKSASKTHHSHTYGRYALKRILRTFPLYYAMVLLIGFNLVPFHHNNAEWSDYLVHLLFLQDYMGATLLTPLWSLATEEKFYLLAPLLWLTVRKLTTIKATIVLTTTVLSLTLLKAVAIYQAESISNYIVFFSQFRAPFHFAIVSILIGVIVALLNPQQGITTQKKHPETAIAITATALTLIIIIFCNLYRTENWQWVNGLHLVITLCFGVVMWFAINNNGIRHLRFLTGRILRVISVLSYALYLTHYAVLPWTNRIHKTYIQSEEAWIHASAFFIIYITLSVAFSLALHYLIEKPFLILKARL